MSGVMHDPNVRTAVYILSAEQYTYVAQLRMRETAKILLRRLDGHMNFEGCGRAYESVRRGMH